jgi:hypothetical protein
MLQREHHLFHRHVALEDEPTRIEQRKARDQTQDKMTVVGIFAAGLTDLGGQQVLEQTEHLLDPVALIPSPNQPRHRDRERHRDEIKRFLTGFVYDDEPHVTIGSTVGAQPHVAASRSMQTPLPGPVVSFDQVRAFNLATIRQREGIR